jgi:type IV secretory pathway TrbL component
MGDRPFAPVSPADLLREARERHVLPYLKRAVGSAPGATAQQRADAAGWGGAPGLARQMRKEQKTTGRMKRRKAPIRARQ